MKTFQIILRSGLTKNIVAEGYNDFINEIVFFAGRNSTWRFPRSDVLILECLSDLSALSPADFESAGNLEDR